MQAIMTKYLSPTNTKPGRIVASATAGRIVVEWDDEQDTEANHLQAAVALADTFDWKGDRYGRLIQGTPAGDNGYVHVFDSVGAVSANVAGEKIEFVKIRHDSNGNPRYVCHFSALDVISGNQSFGVGYRYDAAVKLARTIGGRRFHNKQYGGGIVFQSYSLESTVADISRITGKNYAGYTCR